jgi:hypothetical protein
MPLGAFRPPKLILRQVSAVPEGPDVILAWCRFKRGILSKSRQGRLNLAQDEILGFRTRPDQSREGRLKIAGALSVLRLEEFRHRV